MHLRRPFTEVVAIQTDIVQHLKHIDSWTADQVPDSGLSKRAMLWPVVRPEPFGFALIIVPWNFPVSLLLLPLVAAITAGFAAILKPSEMTQASQDLLVDLIPKRKFDNIFFTGSVNVARHVVRAAAKHLTPTVLELGGQRREIICLSANHVFAHPSVQKKLVERMTFHFNEFNEKGGSDGMMHVVNQKNFDRLKEILEKSQGKIEYGGELDASQNRIAPSALTNVKMTGKLIKNLKSLMPTVRVIVYLNPWPSRRKSIMLIALVIFSTISGGVTVNGVITHATVPAAPFGGVGDSGQYYHGEHGFKAITHSRVIARPLLLYFKFASLLLPPYSADRVKYVSVRNSPGIQRGWSLEDERRVATRGFVAKNSVRLLKILACLAVVGLIDYRMDQRLGVLHGVEAVVVSIWSILEF
ncbi:uncharacterized protein CDV56_109155 [Aspergillus thermomutatus]|uniref:Aldehyde dehydrogenase domain-containing protein n=1 Tax=Aspergillus thermomutatus TaxID=41047 RepID=A0A397HQP3_ASPTH|nr:uncharacterized protein CDV56_109155 [Aspergillus thermomutatus]RHZ64308.1 hypothetical protein CDV56_109155 [Aspergillus thermomutatus]